MNPPSTSESKFWQRFRLRRQRMMMSVGAVLTAVAALFVFTGVAPAEAATQNKTGLCSNGDIGVVDNFTYTSTTSVPYLFGVQSALGRGIDKWDVVRFDKNGTRYEGVTYNNNNDALDSRTPSGWASRSRSLGLYERFTIYYVGDATADCVIRITEP